MSEELPVKHYKKQILHAVENHSVTILSAETGSGKTTQLPQFLIQAGYIIDDRKIGVVLPRKIAAISIAKRVNEELGCSNSEIAHRVRFNSTVNSNTRVVFMTDGSLVQQLYSSPLLQEYSVIILDDVHERSINYDILFSFLKRILTLRRDFKVIVTSATADTEAISSFFTTQRDYKKEERPLTAKTVNITGRLHEVFVHYLRQPTRNYFLKIFQTIVYIDRQKAHGHVLVFLTSVEEIEGMIHMLDSYSVENKRRLKLMPLHAKLGVEQQNAIFQKSYDRKIILSTNIAQSSITIPDIRYVIDSGYVKIKTFDWQGGIDKMVVVPCGKSSANQRAGRAGRVTDGECFRIYHQEGYARMPDRLPPQIMRVDLSNIILKLKGLGIADILTFELLQRPDERHIAKAIDLLYAYQLIDQHFELTQKGMKAAELSLDIKNACVLLNSFDARFGCSREILMLVSMLEVQSEIFAGQGLGVLKSKKKVGAKEGDFLTLVNYFLRFNHGNVGQRKRICGQYKLRFPIMEQAVRIYDELLSQIKKFNRFKSAQEQMEHKFGENQQQRKLYEVKSSADEQQAILRCILTGYFPNLAQLQGDGSYLNIRSKEKLTVHPTSILSVVYPQWIVYHQIIKSNSYFIHNGSQIDPEWIFQLAGAYYLDRRKEQAQTSYKKDMDVQRVQEGRKGKEAGLVEVGTTRKKSQGFNTAVFGFKKMKKTTLSFQQDI